VTEQPKQRLQGQQGRVRLEYGSGLVKTGDNQAGDFN
jgi:hypothetical protein